MFTEIELDLDKFEDNFDEMISRSLNVLCSDSMTILQNNSKVLKYLTDKNYEKELGMLVNSIAMAIKHNRLELVQNIILNMKDDVHKLAALEIKYFDEKATLLRTDVYNQFMPKNFKKHAFIAPSLKEIFVILDRTIKLSPTNAAFAIKSATEVGEKSFIEEVIFRANLTSEFVKQINKRYTANFGMTIEDEINALDVQKTKKVVMKEYFLKAL